MNRLCRTLAVLCIFALNSTVPKVQANIAETSKDAFIAVNSAMELYQKVLKDLPWNNLQGSLNNLEQYRNDYSSAAASIISEIKGHMSNGINAYSRSSRSIYDWCNFAIQRLDSYVKLFNDLTTSNIQKQRDLLVQVLDEGIKKMDTAQHELGSSSSSFNNAAGRLTALKTQFGRDFDSNSAYFQDQISKRRWEAYGSAAIFGPIAWAIAAGVVEGKLVPDLKAKIRDVENFYGDVDRIVAAASVGIDETKDRLKREIRVIGDLKVATEETNTFVSVDYVPELRKTIIDSANSLIDRCNEYAKRYKTLF